jgi:hypothetical protein
MVYVLIKVLMLITHYFANVANRSILGFAKFANKFVTATQLTALTKKSPLPHSKVLYY